LDINLEESSVTVEKLATEDAEAEIRILEASAASTSTPTQPTESPEVNAAEENIFDLMF
jgi:hypothetical protein